MDMYQDDAMGEMDKKPPEDHGRMTVGDIIDALQRFDRDRIVCIAGGRQMTCKAVVSVEPAGAVMVVGDPRTYIDAIDGRIEAASSYSSWVAG